MSRCGRKKNSEQLKPISAQKKQALETYRQRMIRENKTCIPLNDHWYVVLDTVDKKPKMTTANICTLLQSFLLVKGIQWSQAEVDELAKFMDVKMAKFSTKVQVARLTDKKPLKLFLQKV